MALVPATHCSSIAIYIAAIHIESSNAHPYQNPFAHNEIVLLSHKSPNN